jgi:hypothetical protein
MALFVPLGIAGFAVFIAVGGAIVRLLWNWLTPALFGWPTLTFWQALGLLALCRILFGGLGRGGSRYRSRGRWDRRGMTPEERERLAERLRARWGSAPPPAPDPKPDAR